MATLWRTLSRAEKIVWALLVLATLLLTIQKVQHPHDYNNYLIFRSSFTHLVNHQDLYAEYPADHFDYYKYSPTFAALMMQWTWLPAAVGAVFWNLLSLGLFAGALFSVKLTSAQRTAAAWICLPELIGNIQNFQTNAQLAALFVMTFALLERKHFLWAGLLLAVSAHVKIFGVSMLALGLLYPGAWRFWLSSALWLAALAALPLAFVSLDQLAALYHSWLNLLVWDSNASHGISFMGAFYGLTGIALPNLPVQLIAGIILVLPFLKVRSQSTPAFRLLALVSVMMWMIVFNHKSESPTYIIGMMAFALWYVTTKVSWRNWALWITLFFVSLCYSDAVPSIVAKNFVSPFEVKAWPLIALWFWLQWDLWSKKA